MFSVGDIAVCINNEPDDIDPLAPLLILRRHYKVATIGELHGKQAIGFRELPSDRSGKAWGWQASRFRKVKPASKSFTEMVRQMKPHRVGEPA